MDNLGLFFDYFLAELLLMAENLNLQKYAKMAVNS